MIRMLGYAGMISRVDLSRGSFKVEPLPNQMVKFYMGGNGFGVR